MMSIVVPRPWISLISRTVAWGSLLKASLFFRWFWQKLTMYHTCRLFRLPCEQTWDKWIHKWRGLRFPRTGQRSANSSLRTYWWSASVACRTHLSCGFSASWSYLWCLTEHLISTRTACRFCSEPTQNALVFLSAGNFFVVFVLNGKFDEIK